MHMRGSEDAKIGAREWGSKLMTCGKSAGFRFWLRANEQDAEQRKAPAISEGEMGVAAATASGWKHGKNHDELEGGDRGNKLLPTFHTVSLCC